MTPEEAYEEALRRIREAEEMRPERVPSAWARTGNHINRDACDTMGGFRLFLSRLSALLMAPRTFASSKKMKSRTGALDLNLRELPLNRLPLELERLTSLQTLDLCGCGQLSDLSPLAGLTSLQWLVLHKCSWWQSDLSPLPNLTKLQSLVLSECKLFSDLSPLAGLTSLRKLYLDECDGVRQFAPLEFLLHTLAHLSLRYCKFDDLSPEFCDGANVLI